MTANKPGKQGEIATYKGFGPALITTAEVLDSLKSDKSIPGDLESKVVDRLSRRYLRVKKELVKKTSVLHNGAEDIDSFTCKQQQQGSWRKHDAQYS